MLFSGESGRCNLRILLPLPPSLLSPPHCPTRSSCRQGCGTMELFAWWGNNWNDNSIILDLSWSSGLSVWLIARPMFALVGLGFHLLTPAASLLLDQRLRREWPARCLPFSFTSIKIKINQSPNWCFRLLLRAAREDVGEGVEEGEDGQPGKVSPSRHLAPSLLQMVYLA